MADLDLETVIEHAARAAHEANRSWCLMLGDTSQVAWEDADLEIQASARNGVIGVLDGNGPEDSHKSWLREKVRNGWVYGPTKSAVHKRHPCMVPYAELAPEQRAKELVFVNVVKTFIVAAEQA